jgi:hypothetical protein
LPPKDLKIRICGTVILPVALHGCETLSLRLREEDRLSMLENRVLRKVLGPKKEWRILHKGSFVICTPHKTLFR